MDNKKILIGLGILAVAGIGFYFWNKNNKNTESGSEDGAELDLGGVATSGKQTPDYSITASDDVLDDTSANSSLTTRKEKRKACGLKPLKAFKKKRAMWEKCVAEGGIASFDGSNFEDFQNDYMDFSGLNLDL